MGMIDIPPPPHQPAPAAGLDMMAYLTPTQEDPTTTWLTQVATAVRPRLTSGALEAAWHAGEAARLFAVCIALASTLAKLRSAAPDNGELRAHADELARDRAESAAMLKARLEATSLPFVVAQASRLARPDEVASDVLAFLSETARTFDGVPPPKPKPSIDGFLAQTTDQIDFTALDAELLEQLALQTTKPLIATSALGELASRSKDTAIASRILRAKTWDERLKAHALTVLFGRDLDLAVHHMFRMLQDPEPCGRVLLEGMAENVVTEPDRFTTVADGPIVRMLLFRFERIDQAELTKPEAVEGLRELDRKRKALGR